MQRAIVGDHQGHFALRGDDSRCRPRLPQEGIIGNCVSRLHRQRQSSNIQVPTILPDGHYLSLGVQISVGSSGRPWYAPGKPVAPPGFRSSRLLSVIVWSSSAPPDG